ncbi:hypothetical protein PVL29_018241 [Vitis rotundifolia]|uniref:Uncharacterized protein n=1 Tax=Vitis rotundifolia TaxID=103349 RepID=A0AA39DES2_VITRO|nr:hypothetical protein PVL29_018241 [Vitis rotundifolia]
MAIFHALVGRGIVVLHGFGAFSGNTGAVARRIRVKLPVEADSRLCFSSDADSPESDDSEDSTADEDDENGGGRPDGGR